MQVNDLANHREALQTRRPSNVEHMPQRETLLMLLKDLARSGDPRLVVPQLPCFGCLPSPVGCKNRFHFEFGKLLHDVARAPIRSNATFGFGEIVRLQEPIELVVAAGIVFRAHVGIKELRGGLAGFFFGGIARDKNECVVASQQDTSILISKLARFSRGLAGSYILIDPTYGNSPPLRGDFQEFVEIRRAARAIDFVEPQLEATL